MNKNLIISGICILIWLKLLFFFVNSVNDGKYASIVLFISTLITIAIGCILFGFFGEEIKW